MHDTHLIPEPRQFVGWVSEDFDSGDTGGADRNLFDERQVICEAYLCAAARIVVADTDGTYSYS
jgi:hypothetical protein